MKRTRLVLIAVVSTATLACGASAVSGRGAIHANRATRAAIVVAADEPPARNVILMIGDGMGAQEITAARYYQGVQNAMNVDRLPYTGFDTTYSVKKGSGPNYLPDYTPDSASTATMMATGRKTIDERVSQGPSSSSGTPGQNYPTIVDSAQSRGLRVGIVTTAVLSDATPAAMAASMSRRACQGPADMTTCATETKAAGRLGSIAEQLVDQRANVLLGGGRQVFSQTITGGPSAGRTVLQSAQDASYRYVSDTAGLTALAPATAPVLGLFHAQDLPEEWTGPAAVLGKGANPVPCTEGNRAAQYPSLTQMATKAIQLLENPQGFFLMVEGASIDKNAHEANACGQLGETVAFDRAIGAVLDYQAQHPDTLVVVTADHSQAGQIVNDDWSGVNLPTGYSTNVLTRDGSPLTLHYGTSGYGGAGQAPPAAPPSQQHTGGVVPVWAIGPNAANVMGTNDHTELYALIGGTSSSAPAAPAGLAGAPSQTSIALTWSPSAGATSYQVRRDGSVVGTPTGTSFTDTGLTAATRYTYTVAGVNGAGTGPASPGVAVTTTAASTNPPATAPTVTVGTVTGSSVALSWTTVATATSYDVSRNGVVVGTPSTTTFVDTGLAPSTVYQYRVTARNAGGAGPASAVVSATTTSAPIAAYSLSGDTWRYNDTGSDLGTAWRAAGYADGAWKSGPTQAGYGDGDERTVLTWGSNANAKPITNYARRTFDAGASISGVTNLALRLLIDDGAVVYLNGTEIQRINLPTGTITAATRAPVAVAGTAESAWSTFTLPVTALRTGANQLAVEVHQDLPSSSDISFDLELRPVR